VGKTIKESTEESGLGKMQSIGTIINFCTNETRFIGDCLEQAAVFSSKIVVPVATHFFDGTPENYELLDQIYATFPQCLFVEYPFIPDQIPQSIFKRVRPTAFWHCLSRWIGTLFLEENCDSIFFLDADEIANGEKMADWLNSNDYRKYRVLRFANYWYFREPLFQAKNFEDSIVMIDKKCFNRNIALSNEERNALYDLCFEPKKRMVFGSDEKPLFHHFSWVRSEEEMLKKTKSWGHRNDRNWERLIRQEFSAPFSGIDFIHGYQFNRLERAPFPLQFVYHDRGEKNVLRLSTKDVKEMIGIKNKSLWNFLEHILLLKKIKKRI